MVKKFGLPGIDTQQSLADQHLHQVSAVTACSLTLVIHADQRREESQVQTLFPTCMAALYHPDTASLGLQVHTHSLNVTVLLLESVVVHAGFVRRMLREVSVVVHKRNYGHDADDRNRSTVRYHTNSTWQIMLRITQVQG